MGDAVVGDAIEELDEGGEGRCGLGRAPGDGDGEVSAAALENVAGFDEDVGPFEEIVGASVEEEASSCWLGALGEATGVHAHGLENDAGGVVFESLDHV